MSHRRIVSIGIAICLALVVIAGGVFVFKIRPLIWADAEETANEIVLTDRYKAGMKAAGFPITLDRAFEASSYGGLHGDGTAVTIYKFPTNEIPILIEALKSKRPEFTWSHVSSASFFDLRNLIPKELMPTTNSHLLVGRPEGTPFDEFYVDESRGVFYSVSSRF